MRFASLNLPVSAAPVAVAAPSDWRGLSGGGSTVARTRTLRLWHTHNTNMHHMCVNSPPPLQCPGTAGRRHNVVRALQAGGTAWV